MNTVFWDRNLLKICPVCGEAVYISDPDVWAYKMTVSRKGKKSILYFNKYSCKRKFEQCYEEMLYKSRSENHIKNASTRRKEWRGKIREQEGTGATGERMCRDCRYCMKDQYGFRICSCYSYSLNVNKLACKRFKPSYEEEEKSKFDAFNAMSVLEVLEGETANEHTH